MCVLHVLQHPSGDLLTPAAQQRLLTQHEGTTAGILAAGDYVRLFETLSLDSNDSTRECQFAGSLARVQWWRQQQPLHWLQVRELQLQGFVLLLMCRR
jgi:hypothetical protein